ncbi:hypothetical protein CY34DRAFT_372698 [Suillus luteus UH-Slu-Lm8-n1]|uniref:Uncharacterized protein n=1 Tax=Suillus luteus UH-Slu-Lm8-n1 TaxID=930992 RepID=A0A0C9ZM91_9AGAM|nr:hypothetical protein CY34DRAFT_372698 [Suillus luteus UH-Slu-Lm8-n1]
MRVLSSEKAVQMREACWKVAICVYQGAAGNCVPSMDHRPASSSMCPTPVCWDHLSLEEEQMLTLRQQLQPRSTATILATRGTNERMW